MKDIYDLIVVGGGPAGITAGIYAARHNLKTLLVSKGFGGQMSRKTVAIENYTGFEEISGFGLIQKFERHLKKQNIAVRNDEVIDIKKADNFFSVFTKAGGQFFAKAVILAMGAEPKTLEVPGEKEFLGKGVSYCVACDGPIFSQKTVAVAGGGNSAFEAALFLQDIAKKIYILEYGKIIRASALLQEKIKQSKKTEIITGAAIKEIRGEKFVNSIIYQDLASGKSKTINVDGIFVEIGNQPATSFVKGLVLLNEKGEIIIDPGNKTKTQGLFAAGDVTNSAYKQIIISAGDGAKAALSAHNYIQGIDYL